MTAERCRVLYLAPWVDYGGTDKGTIDLLRWIDRDRFAVTLVTTQPSANRRIADCLPYAEDVWVLPDLVEGGDMPGLVLDLLHSRSIDVLFVMNSRLGYELLPDLRALPRPPKVVVQLHVEEQDRSGYVRYVARRYGNLVDRFSVTSQHLADAVAGYGVIGNRIEVIRTGVDAEREFSPTVVRRATEVPEDGRVDVLYPGRLVDQKDPLLMVDVARYVHRRDARVRFWVVGDGPLEDEARAAVARAGLQRAVRFAPPTPDLARWFAASDLLLMTSRYEGVPYVAYEAMAMGLPVVAPGLPGNRELLDEECGRLVARRDDAGAYAEAILELASDPDLRARLGGRARERTLDELSVRRMADEHARIFTELASELPARTVRATGLPPRPRPLRRPRRGEELVSVLVPCFDHGRHIGDCIEAVRGQSWPRLQIVVVDDGSTDPGTVAALDRLAADDDVELVRLPLNRGPSVARNAGLQHCRGRYVLPVDADNMLLPDAVRDLVRQLEAAPDDVAFIYPNLQFFGNRRDYFNAPSFDLQLLLEGNYADTCSLYDAEILGVQRTAFAEDIGLGHEDWDLMLTVAALGYRGQVARGPTVLYRKQGFTRSDLVEHANDPFHQAIVRRHPNLFEGERGRFGTYRGPAQAIKAQWSPGMSLAGLTPVEPDGQGAAAIWRGAATQTAVDFEVILPSRGSWPALPDGQPVRRIHPELGGDRAGRLAELWAASRGPLVLIADDIADALAARSSVEQMLRLMVADPDVAVLALTDAAPRLCPLAPVEHPCSAPPPHAVLLRRGAVEHVMNRDLSAACDRPVSSVVAAFAEDGRVHWRHLSAAHPAADRGRPRRVVMRPRNLAGPAESLVRARRLARPPALPALPEDTVRRWSGSPAWAPTESLPLVRHVEPGTGSRRITNAHEPPRGFVPEHRLGSVHLFQPPGCCELRHGGDHGYYAISDEDHGAARVTRPRAPECLGYLEEVAFPLLQPISVAIVGATGQPTLVGGPNDPLHAGVTDVRTLGFCEAWPAAPHGRPTTPCYADLLPLVRTVDRGLRAHRYHAGRQVPPNVALELGALLREPQVDSVPLRIDREGRVLLDEEPLQDGHAGQSTPRIAARWVLAPLTWRGNAIGAPHFRARAVGRRALDVTRGRRGVLPSRAGGTVAGYLWESSGPSRVPVYRAVHPHTGDVLLTRWPSEANDMGYGPCTLLGYASTLVCASGSFDPRHVDVPWASRFGRRVRRYALA